MAWYRGTEEWAWYNKGSEEPSFEVTWLTTMIWQKLDGQWRTVHTHHSYLPSGDD